MRAVSQSKSRAPTADSAPAQSEDSDASEEDSAEGERGSRAADDAPEARDDVDACWECGKLVEELASSWSPATESSAALIVLLMLGKVSEDGLESAVTGSRGGEGGSHAGVAKVVGRSCCLRWSTAAVAGCQNGCCWTCPG